MSALFPFYSVYHPVHESHWSRLNVFWSQPGLTWLSLSSSFTIWYINTRYSDSDFDAHISCSDHCLKVLHLEQRAQNISISVVDELIAIINAEKKQQNEHFSISLYLYNDIWKHNILLNQRSCSLKKNVRSFLWFHFLWVSFREHSNSSLIS